MYEYVYVLILAVLKQCDKCRWEECLKISGCRCAKLSETDVLYLVLSNDKILSEYYNTTTQEQTRWYHGIFNRCWYYSPNYSEYECNPVRLCSCIIFYNLVLCRYMWQEEMDTFSNQIFNVIHRLHCYKVPSLFPPVMHYNKNCPVFPWKTGATPRAGVFTHHAGGEREQSESQQAAELSAVVTELWGELQTLSQSHRGLC